MQRNTKGFRCLGLGMLLVIFSACAPPPGLADELTKTPGMVMLYAESTTAFGSLTWSPRGDRLAFTNQADLLIINSDGSGLFELESIAHYGVTGVSWSPDGQKVVFTATDPQGLYFVELRSTMVTPLGTLDSLHYYAPAWSLDGKWIAFAGASDTSNSDIFVVPISKEGRPLSNPPVRLTNDPGWEESPTWSPDSSKIAYSASVGDAYSSICVVNRDGDSKTCLTDIPDDPLNHPYRRDRWPAWSPDGQSIAFVRESSSDDGLYLLDPETQQIDLLIRATRAFQTPAWSPDSHKIAFLYGVFNASPQHCTSSLYVMPISTSSEP